jgi:ribosomal protein S18 acetylase RimI-like enzyme
MDGNGNGVIIRALRGEDVGRLVCMDEQITGRNRRAWYQGAVERALSGSDLKISLGAEMDGTLVGAVLGSLQYGEFGVPEPVAVLDTILVDRGFQGRGIATEILLQLMKNLKALGIERLRTEVAWNEHELAGFLDKSGFAPAARLVLERSLTGPD